MKMDTLFGAKISYMKVQDGVLPHVIIPKQGMTLEDKDRLLSSLPISSGHLVMADKNLSFLFALLSSAQKKVIGLDPGIRYVGEANVDIEALTLLVKDGMHVLSNPNIRKDIS